MGVGVMNSGSVPWGTKGVWSNLIFSSWCKHWNTLSRLGWDQAQDAPGPGLILELVSAKERGGQEGPQGWVGEQSPPYLSLAQDGARVQIK